MALFCEDFFMKAFKFWAKKKRLCIINMMQVHHCRVNRFQYVRIYKFAKIKLESICSVQFYCNTINMTFTIQIFIMFNTKILFNKIWGQSLFILSLILILLPIFLWWLKVTDIVFCILEKCYLHSTIQLSFSYWNLQIYWRRTLRSEKIFGNWKPFKNDDKCFLFHLKSSFRSQDIQFFVLTFWSCRKTEVNCTLMQIWKSVNIFIFTYTMICRRFHIITPFVFWDTRTRDMWNVCLQTYGNNRIR